jgi:2,5-diketo-D-gluconate reductase B
MKSINGIPQFGLGTWQRKGPEGRALIAEALAMGYRHIDTAQSYDTEQHVGAAMMESGLGREAFFVTTKVATTNLARKHFLPSFAGSLERLGIDRIDLTLIHWPSVDPSVPFDHTVEDLGEAQARGWTRLIGVSNFPIALLERAEAILGPGRIVNNQVEVHPFLQNRKLRAHCAERGIAVTAYLPLARGKTADDPVLRRIGGKHGATGAQVSLAFLMQEGLVVIPATSRPERLAENLGALDVRLDEEDMAAIRALDRSERLVDPAHAPAWD